MFAYHLHRVRIPRLLVIGAGLACVVWIGFRAGGTEVGEGFGLWGMGRYWAVITPCLLFFLVPMLDRLWHKNSLMLGWRLGQVGGARAGIDGLLNFLAGYLVYATFVVVLGIFPAIRMSDAESSVVLVTVAGPLIGGYMVLMAGHIMAYWMNLQIMRFLTVMLLAILDAINELPTVVWSLSGTSHLVRQAGVWHSSLLGGDPMTAVTVDPAFLVSRAAVCGILTSVFVVAAGRAGRSSRRV
ncbi:hypothetical protein [Nonomuraea sp. NEAU-A123]|uniref:hypothetical protein n=1 Tax=Nonomuraea sp. NEAU-A123 TaxID=2839649 RepID=UPI001BE41172|nr:hypothetical protein [Nonomuraea sp. NEAU-A123]MBT2231785.1 hypothetical protein [Nonomuraea sp. NEAU-A123]